MDATDYKTGTDGEQYEVDGTVGSGLTWSFSNDNGSKENTETQERS